MPWEQNTIMNFLLKNIIRKEALWCVEIVAQFKRNATLIISSKFGRGRCDLWLFWLLQRECDQNLMLSQDFQGAREPRKTIRILRRFLSELAHVHRLNPCNYRHLWRVQSIVLPPGYRIARRTLLLKKLIKEPELSHQKECAVMPNPPVNFVFKLFCFFVVSCFWLILYFYFETQPCVSYEAGYSRHCLSFVFFAQMNGCLSLFNFWAWVDGVELDRQDSVLYDRFLHFGFTG